VADIRSNNKEQFIKNILNIAGIGGGLLAQLLQYDKRQLLEKEIVL
jgi:hypothetical protein